jgi:1-aminocyclopropane-1-carboxylate deaminase/D-cysteine desulfhydrase-like pyridoxal-dependent ACC family enzyme
MHGTRKTVTPPLTVDELEQRVGNIPRVTLAQLPTPLEYCPNLTARLAGPPIWIKRDDLTGLATGGNKTRYLEYVMAHAQAAGADTVVLSSSNQSNHLRQAAAAAAKLGFKSVLLCWGSEPGELDGNLLLDHILGAEIHHLDLAEDPTAPGEDGLAKTLPFASGSPPSDRTLLNAAIEDAVARLQRQGRRPYCINTDPPAALPAIGYVRCAVELTRQMEEAGIDCAQVFVTSGGATHAGLLLGSLLLGSTFRVTGISYHAASAARCAEHIATMATHAARLLGCDLEVTPDQVDSDPTYATQPLYADTGARWESVLDVARSEGILLDPTYSGRAMMAICDRVRTGRLPGDRAVVLVHSGGTPLLFPLGRATGF